MEIIYNGKLIKEAELKVELGNRAFEYGDGLFETIIKRNGKIRFLADHIARLQKGLKLLDIEYPGPLDYLQLHQNINELLHVNGIEGDARIKLIVWRSAGGLFTPAKTKAEYRIDAKPISRFTWTPLEQVGFSESIKLFPHTLSAFKSLSAMTYVLAGLEKKRKGLDELILLNHQGHVAECTSSNIFWVKAGVYYTPSISTGCIDGILRKQLVKFLNDQGIEVKYAIASPSELKNADEVFSCNAAGIRPFLNLEASTYNTKNHIISGFIEHIYLG